MQIVNFLGGKIVNSIFEFWKQGEEASKGAEASKGEEAEAEKKNLKPTDQASGNNPLGPQDPDPTTQPGLPDPSDPLPEFNWKIAQKLDIGIWKNGKYVEWEGGDATASEDSDIEKELEAQLWELEEWGFIALGSNWAIKCIDFYQLKFAKYNLLGGSSYIPTPASIVKNTLLLTYKTRTNFAFCIAYLPRFTPLIWTHIV